MNEMVKNNNEDLNNEMGHVSPDRNVAGLNFHSHSPYKYHRSMNNGLLPGTLSNNQLNDKGFRSNNQGELLNNINRYPKNITDDLMAGWNKDA